MKGKFRLNLPKTKFPLRADPLTNEPRVKQLADLEGHYAWQRGHNKKGDFLLHDGPPYANGRPHMGHVMNRVLKDIINRHKAMLGFRVHFRPGWDCHGLPIELKACRDLDSVSTSPLKIRQKAKKFAKKTIKEQMECFKQWGVMADWQSPYSTMDKDYEANQLQIFYEMYKQGCIYRGLKPVYWSPSSRSALAEAELEYKDKISPAVYIKFPLVHSPGLDPYLGGLKGSLHAAVWTTTPWTLLSNKAICYSPELQYAVVQLQSGDAVVMATKRVENLAHVLGPDFKVLTTVPGSGLLGASYINPLRPEDGDLPLLAGDHVTGDTGTGLVHTAPAHGLDDYHIGTRHNLPLFSPVDDNGCYTSEVGPDLEGMSVITDGSQAVISKLDLLKAILHSESYTHRYPHDWRTKGPVILRTTRQWFAAVGDISAEEALPGVQMVPETSYNRLSSFLKGRQDWCISRQRYWGVPIPVFYHIGTGDHLINDDCIAHIKHLFLQHGSDCWWALPMSQLLPSSMEDKVDIYKRGNDTMDVWFDSGTSWATVLKESDGAADMYLEGSDQHRGWFQSSLITSYLTRRRSPYKCVLTHGFVLDAKGIKMSKSLGNVISPEDIIEKQKFGVDAMRMWVALSDFTGDVSISTQILQQTREHLQKLRNTCRFMLGNLYDFDPAIHAVPIESLSPLDKYMLHLLYQYCKEVKSNYEKFDFSKVCQSAINLATKDLSTFYFEIIKDSLYCDEVSGVARRGIQTVLHHLLVQVLMTLAPVLPHLTEEVALAYPFMEEGVFKRGWWACPEEWYSPATVEIFHVVRDLRDIVMKVLEQARVSKAIGSSLEAEVNIRLSDPCFIDTLSKHLQFEPVKFLEDICVVSNVRLEQDQSAGRDLSFSTRGLITQSKKECEVVVSAIPLVTSSSDKYKCPRCWKYHSKYLEGLCQRCQNVEHTLS